MLRMETLTGAEVRDFRVCANYFNYRSLLGHAESHSRHTGIASQMPGYSPPVVEFETQEGTSGRLVVGESDLYYLCGDNYEEGKIYLGRILRARQGDSQAIKELALAAQHLLASPRQVISETDFVVPSTSSHPHSEQDISQKGFILLKLTQQGYPVP